MKPAIACFILFLLATFARPNTVKAQTWSDAELETLDFTENCWQMSSEEQVDRYLDE